MNHYKVLCRSQRCGRSIYVSKIQTLVHRGAVWLGTSDETSLSLSFLIYKTAIMPSPHCCALPLAPHHAPLCTQLILLPYTNLSHTGCLYRRQESYMGRFHPHGNNDSITRWVFSEKFSLKANVLCFFNYFWFGVSMRGPLRGFARTTFVFWF